jgi:hypothetical protein
MLDHHLSRRAFAVAWAHALLGGAAITLTGCGGDSSSPAAPRVPDFVDKVGVISNNHGHSATITAAQLTAGGALELDIQGNATHDHRVSLSSSEILDIRSGTRVTRTSTTDEGHSHSVTFN